MGAARRGVMSGGTVIIDLNKKVDRYPPREELALIEGEAEDSGGPAFNMAVDLARLGAPFPVELVGVVGDDAHGAKVREICRAAGIGASGLVVREGATTSYTDVMIEGDGRRTFFHRVGANALLAPEQFDFERSSARILHLGAPGLHDALDAPRASGNGFTEVLARARSAGLATNMELVSLEPARLRALAGPCLPLLDYLIVNELEAGALAGVEPHVDGRTDPARMEEAARALVGAGVGRLCVIHFPEGCVASDAAGRAWRHGAVRVPPGEVKSTNGAGDAFASGVLYGLHEGFPVERCLRLGACVAAASLASYSTSGAIRPAAECLARGEAAGFREL